MVKISINQNDCLGCSLCGDYAPEIFEVSQQNFKCFLKQKGQFLSSASFDLTPEQIQKVDKVLRDCPVQAVKTSKDV